MKKSFFSRLFRSMAGEKNVDKPVATPDDIRRKLENYQSQEGPARFGGAGVYYVSEIDDEVSSSESKRLIPEQE